MRRQLQDHHQRERPHLPILYSAPDGRRPIAAFYISCLLGAPSENRAGMLRGSRS
jgi:hypothetical protein